MDSEKLYAIKIVRLDKNPVSNIKTFKNEVNVLQKLSHPNIVSMHESGVDGVLTNPNWSQKEVAYTVLNLAKRGDLFNWVKKFKGLSEEVARYFIKQLIEALDHCHKKGYAHKDIKLVNLLIDENFNLLLADFGFSDLLHGEDGDGLQYTACGTDSYMAPELHGSQPYNGCSADLFSIGCVLFATVVGHPAFGKAMPNDITYKYFFKHRIDKFWKKHESWNPEVIQNLSEEFKSLIECLLALNPVHRASLSEIQVHPWYKGVSATRAEVWMELVQ